MLPAVASPRTTALRIVGYTVALGAHSPLLPSGRHGRAVPGRGDPARRLVPVARARLLGSPTPSWRCVCSRGPSRTSRCCSVSWPSTSSFAHDWWICPISVAEYYFEPTVVADRRARGRDDRPQPPSAHRRPGWPPSWATVTTRSSAASTSVSRSCTWWWHVAGDCSRSSRSTAGSAPSRQPGGGLHQLLTFRHRRLLLPATVILGLALYVVPLQVGASTIAFPRAAAASFWAWLLGQRPPACLLPDDGGPGGVDFDGVLWLFRSPSCSPRSRRGARSARGDRARPTVPPACGSIRSPSSRGPSHGRDHVDSRSRCWSPWCSSLSTSATAQACSACREAIFGGSCGPSAPQIYAYIAYARLSAEVAVSTRSPVQLVARRDAWCWVLRAISVLGFGAWGSCHHVPGGCSTRRCS